MSTKEEARAAKEKFSEQFLNGDFNSAARLPVNSVGVGRDTTSGYVVRVGLERPMTKAEDTRLPKIYDGVPVRYEVIGPIRPL